MAQVQFTNIGTFSSDGDWADAANWPTGGVPLDGEECVVRGTTNDLDTNLDQNLIDLDRLTFDPTCLHKIGSSGNRLIIDTQGPTDGPGHLIYEGAGSEAWFTVDTKVFVAKASTYGPDACVVRSRSTDIDEVQVYDGHVRLDGGTYTLVNMVARASQSSRCVIEAGSTLVTVNVSAGVIECNATDTITTCNVSGTGTFEHLKAQAITNLYIRGGTFRFDGAATITNVYVYDGLFDWSRTSENKTATTVYGLGGTMDLRNSGVPNIGTIVNPGSAMKILGAEWLV